MRTDIDDEDDMDRETISDVEGAAEARSVSGPISVLARSRARVRAVGQSGPDSHWIGGDELGTRESTREPAPAGDRPVPAPADQAGRRGAGSATAPRGAPGRKGQGRSPSSGNKGCGPFGIPSVRARVGTYQDHHDRGTCPCPNTLNGFTPRTQQLHWLVVCGACSGGFNPVLQLSDPLYHTLNGLQFRSAPAWERTRVESMGRRWRNPSRRRTVGGWPTRLRGEWPGDAHW